MASHEQLYLLAIKAGLNRKWHLQRSKVKTTQSLLVHALNVTSIAGSLSKVLNVANKDMMIALGAAFIHDTAKARDEAQQVLTSGRGQLLHKDSDAVSDEALRDILVEIGISEHDTISECIAVARAMEELESVTHMTDILKTPPKSAKLVDIVMLADELASIRDLSSIRIEGTKIERTLKKLGLHIYYYKVSLARGILTQLLHKAMLSVIKNKNGVPTIFYADGILFVSKTTIEDPTSEEIKISLKKEIDEFLSRIDPDKLGKAVFGGITQTVIVAPELLAANPAAIKSFWAFIGKQRFIRNPQLPPDAKQRERWQRLIREKYGLKEGQLVEEKFKEIRAILYLTQIFKEIYKLSLQNTRVKDITLDGLVNNIGLPKEKAETLFPEFMKVSQTTKAEDGLTVYEELTSLGTLSKLRRTEAIEKFLQSYARISINFLEENLLKIRFPTEEIAELLINEMEKPFLLPIKDLAEKSFSNYSEGKAKGGICCALCSKVPDEEAPAPLVGDSTEAFTNFVKGGTRLGGRNKAKICKLCSYEAKIRSIFLKNPEETIFVFPQVQIGEQTANIWQKIVEHLSIAQYNGVPALQELDTWSELFLQKKINEKTDEIFRGLFENSRNWRIGVISRKIENEYKSVENFLEIFGPSNGNVKYESLKELAEAIMNKRIEIPEYVNAELQLSLSDAARFSARMESPNYIVIMLSGLRHKKGKTEESETSYFLRKLFLGLILARLFLASVTFMQIPLEIKFLTTPRGYLEAPRKIGLTEIYERLGVSDWIELAQVDDMTARTAALIQIDQIINRRTNIGKDSLYILAKESSGRILNRYLQATGDLHNSQLVSLLKVWNEAKPERSKKNE